MLPGLRGTERRVPAKALAAAGVVLVSSWALVTLSIDAAQRSREQAREFAVISANAAALSDLAQVFDAGTDVAVLRQGVAASQRNYAALISALGRLPDTAETRALRTSVLGLVGPGFRIRSAVARGDVREALRIDRTEIGPRLETLDAASRRATTRQLDRAERADDIAQLSSGLALLVGSAGLGLVGLGLSRTRQRALVARTREEVEARSSSRLDALVSHATDAVTVLDAHGPRDVDPEHAELSRGVALSASSASTSPTSSTPPTVAVARKHSRSSWHRPAAATTTHLRLASSDGAQRPVEVHGENRLADPAIEGVILTIRDVSERTLLEDQLERLASRDPITGVANRAQLEAHLQNAVARRDARGGFAGLLLVDLDDFRAVSDTLGHDAGDELLRHAARRLERAAGDGDLVARLDGDTFGVLLDDLRSVSDGQARASAILAALRGRAAITGGHSVELDAHGGLAFGAIEMPAREIIRHADIALLEAKARKVPHVVSFTDQMLGRVTERVALTGDLRRATEREEFDVDYQPIVDIVTGRTVAASKRWRAGRIRPWTPRARCVRRPGRADRPDPAAWRTRAAPVLSRHRRAARGEPGRRRLRQRERLGASARGS